MPENKRTDYLTSRLNGLGNHILGQRLLLGSLIICATACAFILAANLSHLLFYLPIWFRTGFLIILTISIILALAWLIVRPLVRHSSPEELALLVEKKYPNLKNRLIASLQLEKKLIINRENYSPALIHQCILQAEQLTGDLDFRPSYRVARMGQVLRFFATGLILTLALEIISPALFSSSFNVFSHPLTEIPRELTYKLEISPKSVEVLKFDNLDIKALVYGSKLPNDGKIFWKVSDSWHEDKIETTGLSSDLPEALAALLTGATDTLLYKFTFKEIRHDLEYYVEAGELRSPVYAIHIVDKPRINNLKLTYFYPKYTRLAPVVIDENDGTIQALKGTNVKIEAELNEPIESGRIIFEDGHANSAQIERNRLIASLQVLKDGSYHLEAIDSLGHANPDPIEYRIITLPDNDPQISIVKPGGNIDLNDYMAFDLAAALSDDFGFSRLVLHYQIHLSETEVRSDSTIFKFDLNKTNQQVEFYWDLSKAGLFPGSYVDYYMEVFDNDYISGPKSAISPTYIARNPSLNEMVADVEDAREDMISEMIEALKEEKKIKEETQKQKEDLQFQDDLKWENQKDIEKTAQKQQDLINQFQNLAQKFEQVNEAAKEKDLMTLEMMQKLAEFQKLFEKIATPEMKEALRKMQEAIDKMDKNELERAMQDFQMSTQEMIKNIERSIAQLKEFQVEQKMQAMVAQAEKILENQNKVNDKASGSKSGELPKLKSSEDQNQKDLNDLKKEAASLREQLKENDLNVNPGGEKFCQAVEKTDADQDMEKMSQSLQEMDKTSSMASGQTSSVKLEDMLGKMKDAQAEFTGQMSAEAAQKMREAIDDLLKLSDNQEQLYNETISASPQSNLLPNLAPRQQDLKSEAERVRVELLEIAKQSVFVQNAVDEFMQRATQMMDNSMSALSNRSGESAGANQNDGIYSLNRTAQSLMESLNNESQCNSSCDKNQGMFSKMKKLSQGQNKVNRETQSSCNNPGEKPGKPDPNALRRLAVEQNQIRNGIAEMVDEYGDRKDMLGRLDKMADEMKKIIEALESGEVNPETLERQKNIYSRMLDFQLSLEQRDYSEKRRAEQGENLARKSPANLDLEKHPGESAYRAKLAKFLDEAYPPEYETLIKDYYKALMQFQNK